MQRLEEADLSRLVDIVTYGERAVRHLGTLNVESFLADEKTFDSVIRCLSVVGEAAWKLTKATQLAHPDVPWLLIAGMRHRLFHDYGEIDPSTAFKAAKEHLPALLGRVRQILRDNGEDY